MTENAADTSKASSNTTQGACPTNVHVPPFGGKTAPDGVRIRESWHLDSSVIGHFNGNENHQFEAWSYGDRVIDIWTGLGDERWFKPVGINGWVASAVINGEPPGNIPLQCHQ